MRHAASSIAAFGLVLFGSVGSAFADDKPADPPATPAAAAAPVQKDKTPNGDEQEELKHVTITANPLSLLLTRIGVNVEYLPIKHHAIVLNPYFQSLSAGSDDTIKTSYTNFGAELGYHLYTGERGANGFFVGPSLLYTRANSTTTAPNTPSASSGTDIYGVALDLGGQHITKGGFTIGGGVGVMYLTSSSTASAGQTSSTFKFSGVLPRLLLTVGYSF